MKMTMTKDTLRQLINGLAILVTLVVNRLANAIPFNGQTTGEVSDRFHVFFVPAGYVFAIWGVIYLGLIAFAIYQALPSQRDNPRLRRLGYIFAVANLANAIWLFFWHFNLFPASLVTMLVLLVLLIATYLILGVGKSEVTAGERWLVHLPVSIYLGWISVATIANFSDVLYDIDWNGFGIPPQSWAVIMMAIVLVLAVAMALVRHDVAYLLVLVWSFVGIALKQSSAKFVAGSAWVAAVLALLLAILAVVSKPRKPNKLPGPPVVPPPHPKNGM